MLKRLIFAGILAAPLAVMAVTVPGQASASVVQPLVLNQVTPIHFGTVIDTTAAGGVIELDAHGIATPDAASGLVAAGAPSAGSFTVATAPNAHYTVAVLPTQFDITRAGGGETMRVHLGWLRFSSDPGNLYPTHGGLAGQTDGAGQGHFETFASLTVGAAQVPGNYTGNYNVTVEYQ